MKTIGEQVKRNEEIVKLRMEGGLLQEIASIYGISRERVRQIVDKVKISRVVPKWLEFLRLRIARYKCEVCETAFGLKAAYAFDTTEKQVEAVIVLCEHDFIEHEKFFIAESPTEVRLRKLKAKYEADPEIWKCQNPQCGKTEIQPFKKGEKKLGLCCDRRCWREWKQGERDKEKERKCNICKKIKSRNEFYQHQVEYDGLVSSYLYLQCKSCHEDITKKWLRDNPEKAREIGRKAVAKWNKKNLWRVNINRRLSYIRQQERMKIDPV